MNICILSGRLSADPEFVHKGDMLIAKFSIAMSEKDGSSSFYNCAAFGGTADFIKKYVKKGMKVLVKGKLSQGRWVDKDGKNRSSISIVVNIFEVCEWPKDGDSGIKKQETVKPKEATLDIDKEEIPF